MSDNFSRGDLDLSPMLSQPDQSDNAPMISGRSTKIIADARGAYLAGNIQALLSVMNEHQTRTFREAAIRSTYTYIEHAFRLLPADAPEHGYLALVHEVPIYQVDSTLLTALRRDQIISQEMLWRDNQIQGFVTESPAGDVLLRLALALNNPSLLGFYSTLNDAVVQACWIDLEGISPYAWNYRIATTRYRRLFSRLVGGRFMLENAWAVLHGRNPPAHTASYPPGQCQTSDLATLIRQMGKLRRPLFRHTIVRQGLAAIQRYMPWAASHSDVQACLNAVQDWLDEPSESPISRAVEALNRIGYDFRPREQARRHSVLALIDAIRAKNELRAATLVMEVFYAPVLNEGYFHNPPPPPDSVQWWQIQAAWAILHDEEPPRLWADQRESVE